MQVVEDAKHMTAVGLRGDATTRSKVASNRVMALWRTVIGKKIVMAVTGVVLIGFVFGHMVGNLKMFSGPDEINAYSRFLRKCGSPELAYGQLLWLVRIVLLICVTLHITAAVQLTRMSWAARPIGYSVKRNIETTFAARMMRWGGVLLVALHHFPPAALDRRRRRIQGRAVQASRRLPKRGGGVRRLARVALLHRGDGRIVPAPRPRHLEHAANARLEHRPKRSDAEDGFVCS